MKFSKLQPHEQFRYLQSRDLGIDKLYFQAKDDLIRLTIVQKSGNVVLARRLYGNTKYRKVKAALEQFLAQPAMGEYKGGSSVKDLAKISAIIKQIISPDAKLTDEEMKAWAETTEKLNQHNEKIRNFIQRVLFHMTNKVDEDFPVDYYFKILVNTLAQKLAEGEKIELPSKEEGSNGN